MPEKKKITVAIASDFLSALTKIPRGKQGKVLDFVTKFRMDSTRTGINYEKIQGAKDKNLYSVRIDQAYRGVVLKPSQGKVFVLLWVDHHDEAYRWAANKMCSVHPETGSLQVLTVEERTEVVATPSEPGLFDRISDKELTGLGVPELLLPAVREIETEAELDRKAASLPDEASEALYMLASGYTLDEVRRELDRAAEPVAVDVEDFEAALETPDSKRRFFVVDDEQELQEMLHAPLEKWRVFLHPSQRKLVEHAWNGPARVLGGAGTGKTVVAMHRAKWLATHELNAEHDRILFTTFTRNLAADIRENLQKICSDEAFKRIEVINLDRWVAEFLRSEGYSFKVVFDSQTADLWERALAMAPAELGLPPSFYREEWDRVIQPQSIETLKGYFKASRLGRGVPLNRKQRKAAWPVFEEYRLLLNEAGVREGVDAMRDARLLLRSQGRVLPYKAVIVDEAQDMGYQAFKLIRALLPKSDEKPNLFIVGDAHQRIYRHKVVLSHCDIDIRGRGRRLRINYRTTDETRRWAVGLLEGVPIDDLDGGADDQKGYRSLMHGVEPEISAFGSFEEEVTGIGERLKRIGASGGSLASVCLVTRTNKLLDQYEAALRARGVATYRVRRSEADDRRHEGLRLATMHRVKGLEFDHVIIAGVNHDVVPLAVATSDTADQVVRDDAEVNERALLYVASTRAKEDVLVTCFDRPSPFLAVEKT